MSQLIHKQMTDLMKDVGAIGKTSTNSAQGFKFRGIDSVINALYPALCKNSMFMTVDVLDKTEVIKDVTRSNGKAGVDKHVALLVKYTFWSNDGSSISSTVAAEGLDSGDKATNKALSAALKYALIQTLSIPTQDMEDGDSVSPELGTAKTVSNKFGSKPAVTATPTMASAQVIAQNSIYVAPKDLPEQPIGGLNVVDSAVKPEPLVLPASNGTKATFRKPTSTEKPTLNRFVK